MGSQFQGASLKRTRTAGFAVIHSKRAQCLTQMSQYRGGPAGTQPIPLRHGSILLPERIQQNVGHDNRLSAVHGRAARSGLRANEKAVDGLGVSLGKAGGSTVSHMLAVLI